MRATATGLPLDDGVADIVTALDVIEHVADDGAAVAEFRRVLRPGGWLGITVPACPFLWSSWDEVLGHHRRYTAKTLKSLVERAGFRLLRLAYINVPAFPPMVVARVLRRWLGEPSSRGWRFEDWIPPTPLNAFLEWLFVFTACLPGLRFPIGASLLAIGEKMANPESNASSQKSRST
jgi:SAM-dependent methyltransferase